MVGKALVKPACLDTVVKDFPVDAPACQVGDYPVVCGAALREQQGFSPRFFGWRHRNRRHCCRPAGDGFHGLQKGIAVDLDEIVQGAGSADATGKPAPLAVGDPQAVVGLGAVDVAGHMDQLLWVALPQIGE